MIRCALSSGIVLALALAPIDAQNSDADAHTKKLRVAPWPPNVLAQAARIPVQESGRIKPLHTLAGFQLLRLNGKRSCRTPDGERLCSVAWMLDCMFFPEQAQNYGVVQINDYRVVESIGLSRAGKNRRDRYSYADLAPALAKLLRQASRFEQKPRDARTTIETQVINLARVFSELHEILHSFDFARVEYPISQSKQLREIFPDREKVPFLDMVAEFPGVRSAMQRGGHGEDHNLLNVVSHLSDSLRQRGYLAFLPPVDREDEVYVTATAAIRAQNSTDGRHGGGTMHMAILRRIESLMERRTDLPALSAGIGELQSMLMRRAIERGEYGGIDREVRFYEADWFGKALYCFLLGFLFCSLLWIRPRTRLFYFAAAGLAATGQAVLLTGIISRCVLRGRPPVTTPYEVILFVVAVAIFIAMFVEYTRRNGLSLSITNTVGALGMWLAAWHEVMEGTDTMQPLVAVLDTNFWLATHVTTVTLGYCAGILAALIAHLYIFGKLLRFRSNDRGFYADLAKIIYGVLCFGLLFATIGTILGGVWANDSWGRFWGWDPKENGALMLVLGYILIAHARMGGYLREHGIAVASVVLGIIVMWAFWGVNLYNVGLHSYGFTETKATATMWYYGVEWTVVVLGCVAWWLPRRGLGPAAGSS